MKNQPASIGFYLQKIITEQFALIEENHPSDNADVELSVNLKFAVNKEQKLVSVISLIKFDFNDQPLIIIEAGCIFNIEEVAWKSFQQKESDEIIIPQGFITHLSVITIGTVRGILHAKTENTAFNKFILPTINVTELVKSDISFK